MVALVGDDGRHVSPIHAEAPAWAGSARSGTPPWRSRRMSPEASTLRTMKPSWSMCAKTMTDGRYRVAGRQSAHEVAEPVGAVRKAEPVEVSSDRGGHAILVPGEAGDAHELEEEVADHRTRQSRVPRVARTRSMKSRARSGSTAAQVSPPYFRAEPTMTPSAAQDLRHGLVPHASVGEHRSGRQDALHGLQVAHGGGLPRDGARHEDGVRDRGDDGRARRSGRLRRSGNRRTRRRR